MLVKTLAQDKANNRHCFIKILEGLRYLARQGCGIRGHDEEEGNLHQLLCLISIIKNYSVKIGLKRKLSATLITIFRMKY